MTETNDIANWPMISDAVVDRVELKGKKCCFWECMPHFATEPEISVFTDDMTHSLTFRLEQWIASQELKRVEAHYPADWWQAFKERWFPEWARRKWPVRYTYLELVAEALYPDIALPKERRYVTLAMLKREMGNK